MKITRLEIDAFGNLFDKSWGPLPEGVVVFLGPNEAGKSTLLAFLRTMFFGFPDKRTNEPGYEPLRPGPFGGRLEVETSRGRRLLIERTRVFDGKRALKVQTKISDSQGNELPESILQEIFGGVNKILYKNVFAFGLGELQGLESLNQASVKDAIYGAGFGTSFLAVPRAQRALETEILSLFRPAGKKQEINKLLARLRDVWSRLGHARSSMDEYLAAKDALDAKREEIASLKKRLLEVNEELSRVRGLKSAWEDYQELCKAESQISFLEKRAGKVLITEADRVRWQQLGQGVNSLEEALLEKKRELGEVSDSLERLRINQALLRHANKIRELFAEIRGVNHLLQEIEEEEMKINGLGASLNELMEALGPGWNRKRLKDFRISLEQKEGIRHIVKELDRLDQAKLPLEERLFIRRQDFSTAEAQLEELRELIGGLEAQVGKWTKDDIAKFLEAVDQLKKRFSELSSLEDEAKRIQGDIDVRVREAGLKGLDLDVLSSLEISPLRHSAGQLSQAITAASRELETLEAAYSQVEKQIANHEERLRKRQERIQEIDTDLSWIEGDIQDVIAAAKAATTTYPSKFQMEALLKDLEGAINEMKNEKGRLDRRRKLYGNLLSLLNIFPIVALGIAGALFYYQ
ncbi:MAG: AAA family ATPase, partial [Thermodesulfobacteria bacterium]|nr:AAA family ATPase [Thermodesulfobacteriota bacterium]